MKLHQLPHPYKVIDLIDERPKGAFHDFLENLFVPFSYSIALF